MLLFLLPMSTLNPITDEREMYIFNPPLPLAGERELFYLLSGSAGEGERLIFLSVSCTCEGSD